MNNLTKLRRLLGMHHWPPKTAGEYFQDGSCEVRLACLSCGKTKYGGIHHEGRYARWNPYCKRCHEILSWWMFDE